MASSRSPAPTNDRGNISPARRVRLFVDNTEHIRVLAMSGSLRRASSNSALVAAVARLAPRAVDVSIYRGLAELPPFNPDIDGDSAPAAVMGFRTALHTCHALLLSSPEYAHGVPGVLKNALDWLVGSGELVDKPIALLNASPRSTYAQTSLMETIRVMSARIVAEASIAVPLPGKKLTEEGMVEDAEISSLVTSAIEAFARAVEDYQMETAEAGSAKGE